MSGMTLYGGTVSTGNALVGLMIGLSGVFQSSASPVTHLYRTNSPLMDTDPTIKELSDSDTELATKLTNLLSSTPSQVKYSQKQLACAENLGVDPSECTKEGQLIRQKKRSAPTTEQQSCASRLGVSTNECNSNGVFINRNEQVSHKILEQLNVDSWDNVTTDDLTGISVLNLENLGLTTISEGDLDGLTGLIFLKLNNNQLTSVELPDTLTSLFSLKLRNNLLTSFTIPNTFTELHTLDLSNNRLLSFTLPDTLISIEFLYLNDNMPTSFTIPDTLTVLDWIYLQNNQLTSFVAPYTLRYLNSVFLNNNQLTSVSVSDNSVNLDLLDVSNNLLSNMNISQYILDRVDTFLLLKTLFSNRDLSISFNKNAVIDIGDTRYHWTLIDTVFENALVSSTSTHDLLQINRDFQFPEASELNEFQRSFISDLQEAFPLIQNICAIRLDVDVSSCNQHGVLIERNEIIKESILLAVSANSWDDVTPDMLSQIKDLRLASAGITSLNSNDLEGLNLRLLYLHNNELSVLPEGLLDKQTDLEIFYAFRNNLSEIPEGFFDNNPNLKKIYLQKNQLQSLPENTFSDTKKLRRLRLHENQLNTLPSDFLSVSTLLRELTLYSNPLQLSENVFTRLQAQEPNAARKFRIVYDRLSTNSNLLVEIGEGTTTPISTVITFFEHATNINNLIFYPSTLAEPGSTTTLTDSQRTFLCRYLENPSLFLEC